MTRAEQFLIEIRNSLQIDGPLLFTNMDNYRLGYLTTRGLQEWLCEAVGFKLNEFEARLILNRYDKNSDYMISLGEFLDEIAPIIIEEPAEGQFEEDLHQSEENSTRQEMKRRYGPDGEGGADVGSDDDE